MIDCGAETAQNVNDNLMALRGEGFLYYSDELHFIKNNYDE